MNLFVQGMRRSGTTIVYDALLEDGDLRCLYEPFTSNKAAIGGGSGMREHDLFAVAIVLDLPEEVCRERNAARADRDFGQHVIRRQCTQLRRSLRDSV